MKLSKIQEGVVANGGTVFNIQSIVTNNKMQVLAKGWTGKFLVKMLSGKKEGEIIEIDDTDRYQLIEAVLTATQTRKKELTEQITAISNENEKLEEQIETNEEKMETLEKELQTLN